MFTLAMSSLTTSHLPWFINLTFQVRMQHLQQLTLLLSPVTSTTMQCICFGFLFTVSWVISPLFSSNILGAYQPGEFIFQCHNFFAFPHCSRGPQGRNTEVVCRSFLQWTTFCQNSPPWPICLRSPYMTWLIVSLS